MGDVLLVGEDRVDDRQVVVLQDAAADQGVFRDFEAGSQVHPVQAGAVGGAPGVGEGAAGKPVALEERTLFGRERIPDALLPFVSNLGVPVPVHAN